MRHLLGCLLLLWGLEAQALALRVCTLDQPFHPFTMPDGSGNAQQLMRLSSKAAGIDFINVFAPRLRCKEMMKAGEVDAMMSAYLPERRSYGAFPMAGTDPDETRQLGAMRFLVYQRHNGGVKWNGRKFTGLGDERVGIIVGMAVTQKLRDLGLSIDEGAKTVEQNFEKLAFGRLSAVVALESDAGQLLDSKFKDRLEVLPKAFDVQPVYLHVNLAFYANNKPAVEQFWKEIRKVRESAAYQQYLKRTRTP
jgi:polar amino acid transport system substrate-binding protein